MKNGWKYSLLNSNTTGGFAVALGLYALYRGVAVPNLGFPDIPEDAAVWMLGGVAGKEAAGKVGGVLAAKS